jgi:hypothetical protein
MSCPQGAVTMPPAHVNRDATPQVARPPKGVAAHVSTREVYKNQMETWLNFGTIIQ